MAGKGMVAIAKALGVGYEHYAARDTIKASITSQLRRLMLVTLSDNLPSRHDSLRKGW
jgi:hypothetical protein